MSDAKDLLRKRIIGDTADQLVTAGKALFDAFTGGAEAVLDSVAEDWEAKGRGEAGAPMRERYRCIECRGMHWAGELCDRRVIARAETIPAPSPEPRRAPVALLTAGFETECVCIACSVDEEEVNPEQRTTFGKKNLRSCERCGQEQGANAYAYVVTKVKR